MVINYISHTETEFEAAQTQREIFVLFKLDDRLCSSHLRNSSRSPPFRSWIYYIKGCYWKPFNKMCSILFVEMLQGLGHRWKSWCRCVGAVRGAKMLNNPGILFLLIKLLFCRMVGEQLTNNKVRLNRKKPHNTVLGLEWSFVSHRIGSFLSIWKPLKRKSPNGSVNFTAEWSE